MAMQWLGWAPEQPSLVEEMAPGISNLIQVLLLQREREQEIANQIYEATNWRIYDLVTNQGFDVADAVDLVRADLESHPEWEQIRRSMEIYTPHAIGSDGEGGVTFRYIPPRDILIMQAETEQQQIIQNHQAELEAEADYRRYGLEEDRAWLDHDINVLTTNIVHELQKENRDLDEGVQVRLRQLENELNKSFKEFDLNLTQELTKELELFLNEIGLGNKAVDFAYQTQLNAQLGAIQEGHLIVDRETQRYLNEQKYFLNEAAAANAQGREHDSAKFYDEIERNREQWAAEVITKPAEERAEAMQARLMRLDDSLQSERILLEGEVAQGLEDSRQTHELLLDAIRGGREIDVIVLQAQLQREIITHEVEAQLGSAKELEMLKNTLVQANMELEAGITTNLATHQAELQYWLNSGLIQDQAVVDLVRDYVGHYNSLQYLDRQGDKEIRVQDHHQQFQSQMFDKEQGISQDIPREHWTSLFNENLQARKDQVGELTDEDYQTAFYLTLDQITKWNEDGSSDREEKLPQLFQALQYFPQLDATRIVGEDTELLESRGIIPPFSEQKKAPKLTLGQMAFPFVPAMKMYGDELGDAPEITGSYGSDFINWLDWLIKPIRKKTGNPLVDNLEELGGGL